MAWFHLVTAGLLEVVWAFAMKQSDGFTRPVSSSISLVAMGLSIWLLSLSMKSLPLGTAYAVWTGIGAVGAFVLGVVILGEPASALRVLGASLLVAGLVLLKVA